MYRLVCSHSRFEELQYALTQLQLPEVVELLAVDWLGHDTVLVKVANEQQTWNVDSASPAEQLTLQ